MGSASGKYLHKPAGKSPQHAIVSVLSAAAEDMEGPVSADDATMTSAVTATGKHQRMSLRGQGDDTDVVQNVSSEEDSFQKDAVEGKRMTKSRISLSFGDLFKTRTKRSDEPPHKKSPEDEWANKGVPAPGCGLQVTRRVETKDSKADRRHSQMEGKDVIDEIPEFNVASGSIEFGKKRLRIEKAMSMEPAPTGNARQKTSM